MGATEADEARGVVPDHLSMITQLGTLATEAAQRGDDRAAATLRDAIALLFEDATAIKALAMRRENESSRQRRSRASRDVTRNHVTERDTPGFSPTPPFPAPLTTPPPPPRASESDAEYRRACETYTELLRTRATSDEWTDIDAFIKRRNYATWKGWLSEMLKLTTGGQATVPDLAQVCRDDAALERPIGSPQGLRGFLRSAAEERLASVRPPLSASPRPLRAAKEDPGAEVFGKIRALVRANPDPRQGTVRFIPLEEVRKLGPAALKAYQSIGGAARVLAAIQKPDTVGFLVNEFSTAYAAAAREVA